MDAQLKKGVLELCLLQLLAGGDKYGYEVLTPLRAAFPDTQESAIYALLRGLGKEGLTSWYMAPGGGGPDRKYYQLTHAGRARLEELLGRRLGSFAVAAVADRETAYDSAV